MVTRTSATIGRRLFTARSKRNLTMAELGSKASVSPSAINHIEKAQRSPSAEIVENLAIALEVDPCWLAYGTGVTPDWKEKKSNA